ncbi:MAG: FAD-binding oxidoreductase, partial [Solirubrobacteraceae bacterium]
MATAVADCARWLREHARGDVRVDPAGRLAYAVDASAYRIVPGAVLVAADEQDLHLALAACRAEGVPLTIRGAGSGMAGQALGEGLVIDCTQLRRVQSIDAGERLARVQPGVVQAELDRHAARHGMCLGPDTASAARATLGGMVANDSAGMRSVIYGRTSHRVRRLRVLRADGVEEWLGETPRARVRGPWREVLSAHDRHRHQIAQRWPALLRCVDGYNLPALGGERPHLARLLCGSEGTLAVVLEAELELDPLPALRSWTVIAPGSLPEAVEVSRRAVAGGASAVELLDAPTLASDPVVSELAAGATIVLLVEHSGDRDSIRAARAVLRGEVGTAPVRFVDDAAEARAVVGMRRNLLALTSRPVGSRRPVNVGEDGAVPPDRLVEYIAGLRAIFRAEGTDSAVTGHISVGCIHTQPLLDLRDPGDRARLRRIAQATAELGISLGGAISGEHGDGISRSELLPRLFGAELCAAFGEVKR